MTDPTGLVTSYAYDADGNLTHTASGANALDTAVNTETVYDKLGRVIQQSQAPDDAGRITTSTTYDRIGRAVLTVTGGGTPVERAVRSEYRADGRIAVTALKRPDLGTNVEATIEYSYSPAGRVTCVKTLIDQSAGTYRFDATDYDPLGRAVRTRTNLVAVSGCQDDAANAAKWATSATGYDTVGRVEWSQTPTQYATDPGDSAFATVYGYDILGRQVSMTTPDPAAPATSTATSARCFNARGEVTRVMDPVGRLTGFEYLPSGRVAKVTDSRGMPSAPADPCAATPLSATTGTTVFHYDGEGNRVERVAYDNAAASVSEQWTYDPSGRVSSHTDALGRATISGTIVVAGKVFARSTVSGSATDAADPTGSSLRKRYEFVFPSGRPYGYVDQRFNTASALVSSYNTSFKYDAVGSTVSVRGEARDELANTVTSDESIVFSHDRGGNVTSVTYPGNEQATYAWDIAGRQVEATIPSGARFRYRYGTRRQVGGVDLFSSGVWLPLAGYTYDADGRKTSEVLLGGLGASRAWEWSSASGRLVAFDQEVRDAQGINQTVLRSHWETTWDRDGRVAGDCVNTTGATTCSGSDRKVDYSYDAAGQLVEAAVTNPHATDVDRRSYTYGNRGERLSQTTTHGSTTVSTTYGYDAVLQLRTEDPDNAAATTYSYDAAGRRVSKNTPGGVTAYRYSDRGLLQGIGSVDVAYDPMGYRAGNIFYDYSGRDPYPQVAMAGSASSSFRFDWGNGFIGVGVNGDPTVFTYGQDPYGTTTESIDTATSQRYFTGPFGDHASGPDPIMYRGDLTTSGTDLDYLRARWYDPATGTFTTQDPLDGVKGTPTVTNPYHYVDNDPLNKTDPSGMRPSDGDFASLDAVSQGCFSRGGNAYFVSPTVVSGEANPIDGCWAVTSCVGNGVFMVGRLQEFGCEHQEALLDTLQMVGKFSTGTFCALATTSAGWAVQGAAGGACAGIADRYMTNARTGRALLEGIATPQVVARDAAIGVLLAGAARGTSVAWGRLRAPSAADDLLPGLPSSAPRPLGLGSTGRTIPANLTEQLAMTEVRSAPGGQIVRVAMTDARWTAADGWVKMAQNVNGVEVHYVRNTITGAVDDFKFASPG